MWRALSVPTHQFITRVTAVCRPNVAVTSFQSLNVSFGLTQQTCLQNEIGAIRYRSNRSRRGLYDGKDVRSGNSVSFSMKATKRKFKPNVFKKRVYSEILDEMIRFHLTAAALRSIDKAGGLDNYLLTSKHVTEGEGLFHKKRILKQLKINKKKEEAGEETTSTPKIEKDSSRSTVNEAINN